MGLAGVYASFNVRKLKIAPNEHESVIFLGAWLPLGVVGYVRKACPVS